MVYLIAKAKNATHFYTKLNFGTNHILGLQWKYHYCHLGHTIEPLKVRNNVNYNA